MKIKRKEIHNFLDELIEADKEGVTEKTEPKSSGAGTQSTLNGRVSRKQVDKTSRILNKVRNALRKAVFGRDNVSNALVFALASNQHLLILGPHGEAKSFLVRKAIDFTNLKGYYTQVHTETSVKDIVGMINPAQALKGNLELVKTKFWDANILYFDEFLRARTEFLDFLLEVLEERTCSKTVLGDQPLPVVSVIATSNPLTDDYNTDDRLDLALKDRFAFIIDVGDHLIASSPTQVERVLNDHDETLSFNGNLSIEPDELRAFNSYAKKNVEVDIPIIRELFDVLKRDKHKFSTRFIKRYKECIQVWALLNKREKATDKDFLEVAKLMLANRFESLTDSEIRKAVSEALSVKEFDAIIKGYDKLHRKKGMEYLKEYIEISEYLKNKSEASFPERVNERRTRAENKFSVEFQSNHDKVVKDKELITKMSTPAFEEYLESLALITEFRTKLLDKKEAKKLRDLVKKIDTNKKLFETKSRETLDIVDNKEVVRERFTISPKKKNPDSFEACSKLRQNSKLREFLLKY